MNLDEELQARILGYLDKVEEGAGFVAEHAPETVQQFLWYEAFECWFVLLCSVLAIIATFVVRRIAQKKLNMSDGDVVASWTASLIVSSLPTLFGGVAIVQLVKIYCAPNVYLLESLAKLV